MKPMPHYIKVKHPSLSKPVYLEHPNLIKKDGLEFVSGYAIDKYGESKFVKDGCMIHVLQLGKGVKIIPQEMHKKYGVLENKKDGKS